MQRTFDAIIIGSGQGGTPLAKKLAGKGWKTALIERNDVGGTCINTGCTPTKTLISSAKTAYTVNHAGEWGIRSKECEVDMPAIIKRKNDIVEGSRKGLQEGLENTENLSLIFGNASFTGKKQIEITGRDGSTETIGAESIFIDTGTRPFIPAIEGLQETGYVTSTTLMDCKEVPEHLLIIGGNYIGLEFGQMYRRFGSKVTIVEHNIRLLSREDEDIAEEVEKFLKEEDIQIYVNSEVQRVSKSKEGIRAELKTGDQIQTISCTHILVAAGTTPNTEDLNLPATGVETDEKGFVKTDEFLQTNVPGIYAIGDVKGGPAFTHISYNDYLVLWKNLIEDKKVSIKNRMVPYCMFTDPQLGRVGVTEKEARDKGTEILVATLEMAHVARARETGHTHGLMKAVVEKASGQIIGAAILGEEGGETMSLIQMAMVGNIPYTDLQEMILAHPTYAESINNLFLSLGKS